MIRACNILVVLACFFLALQGSPSVEVDSRVDLSTITVGDLIHYTVRVVVTGNVDVDLPAQDQDMGKFEVHNHEISGPLKEGMREVWSVKYTLSIYETGSFTIPPVPVNYRSSEIGSESALTQEHSIQVESTLQEDSKDILDIKNPMEIPRSFWSLWPWFATFSGLVGLVSLAVWYLRRKKISHPNEMPQTLQLSPYNEAYQALCNLRDSKLLEENKIKHYYVRLSEILRSYLARQYLIEAMELTTDQVLVRLRNDASFFNCLNSFKQFFSFCDLVKFAKHVPLDPEHDRVTNLAFQILEVARPKNQLPAAIGQDKGTRDSETELALIP